MADQENQTQQTGNDPAPQNEDWKAKYEAAVKKAEEEAKAKAEAEAKLAERERQYQSVQGNLTKAVDDRKKIEAELKNLSDNSELTKAERQAEKEKLEADLLTARELEKTLSQQISQKDSKIEVLELIATEYPMLSDWYKKGRLATEGKTGEELKTFLEGWKQDIEESNLVQKREKGKVPDTPIGGQTTMTFQEVQVAKVQALRTKGANSKEYKDLQAIENQLFKEGKYK